MHARLNQSKMTCHSVRYDLKLPAMVGQTLWAKTAPSLFEENDGYHVCLTDLRRLLLG